MKKSHICTFLSSFLLIVLLASAMFGQILPALQSGKRVKRIVIRNAIVVDGSGKPAAGPFDIVIENDLIAQIVSFDQISVMAGKAKRPDKGDVEIDATGKYVLPGLINLHAHIHDERAGVPMPDTQPERRRTGAGSRPAGCTGRRDSGPGQRRA